MTDNASKAQYGTPTPIASVGPPTHAHPGGSLPYTGHDLGLYVPLAALVLLIGFALRLGLRERKELKGR